MFAFTFILLLLLGSSSLALKNSTESVLNDKKATAEILWDTNGVPHIYAQNEEVMAYAFGWAQAHLHGTALLSLYGRGRGRAAEYWGSANLPLDIYMWANRIPQLAEEYYYLQDPKSIVLCESFADGFTDYINQHSDEVSEDLLVVLPIDGLTVLQHGLHVLYLFTYVGADGMRSSFLENYDFTQDPFYIKNVNSTRHYAAFHQYDPLEDIPKELRDQLGSNAWAVNSPRTMTGITSMLVANPHLPNLWFFRWTEAHLVVESENMDVMGVTLLGLPVLEIAFNQFLGWSHTVNVQRAYSGYQLQLLAPGSSQYLFDGRYLSTTEEEYIIYELLEDGSYQEHVVVVESNVHGFINSRRGDAAIAIRLAGIDDEVRPNVLIQWYNMGKAKTLEEFKQVCGMNQIPMFTNMYADVEGNIGHYFFSFVGNRTGMPGDYEYWGSPVDGTTSDLLWTSVLAWEDLPYAENPPSGYLSNCNEPPWTTTMPFYQPSMDPENYPTWITRPPDMTTRAQIGVRLLETNNNITFEELEQLKLNVFKETTIHCLDELLSACNTFGDANAREGCSVLSTWDRSTNNDSAGATLYNAWFRNGIYVNPWSESNPLGTPNTLSDPQGEVERLSTIVGQWKAEGRALNETYGSVYRYQGQRLEGEYPGNGDSDTFRDSWFVLPSEEGFLYNGGDTIIYVIQFIPNNPPRVRGILQYGNASQRNHPHLNDQMYLASAKSLRDVYFTRSQVENNLERFEFISYPSSNSN